MVINVNRTVEVKQIILTRFTRGPPELPYCKVYEVNLNFGQNII